MNNVTINKLLVVLALVALVVAWIITVGWVDAAGNARDGWLTGGLALFVASFIP
jgi:hypothetical protein